MKREVVMVNWNGPKSLWAHLGMPGGRQEVPGLRQGLLIPWPRGGQGGQGLPVPWPGGGQGGQGLPVPWPGGGQGGQARLGGSQLGVRVMVVKMVRCKWCLLAR